MKQILSQEYKIFRSSFGLPIRMERAGRISNPIGQKIENETSMTIFLDTHAHDYKGSVYYIKNIM